MSAILKELERLKLLHCGSNPHSSLYQPNEAEQRRLIMKNAGDRLVSVVLKREAAKYVFNQKQKLEEELKRDQLELDTTESEELKQEDTFSVKIPISAAKSKKLARKQPKRGGKRYSVFRGNISSGMIISRGTKLSGVLQYNTNGEAILQELQEQGMDQYKDAKKIFDFLAQSFDTGKLCQFHPRRSMEEIDLSQFNTQVSLSSVTRLEDLNQIRKKNGIMLLFDPSINTFGETITLRVKYMKFIDLNTEEEVTKHYTFTSNGNYFHMTLIKDNYRHNEEPSGRQTASGDSRMTITSNNHNENSDQSNAVPAFSDRHHSHNSIPGWNTRPPIFIPASKCTLQIVDLAAYSQNASLTNNLTRLKVYAVSCAGARAGIRRMIETLDAFMVQQTANIILPNGRSSLNHACLYGNIEAVHHLVSMGGNINHRSKHDQHLTPLHQAVIGRQVETVEYLLQHGANQLLKDDKGNSPLHYACMLGDIAISRILMDSTGGRRALLITNNHDLKPIDVCVNHYLRVRVESVMRKHRIFQKPRVSLMERTAS